MVWVFMGHAYRGEGWCAVRFGTSGGTLTSLLNDTLNHCNNCSSFLFYKTKKQNNPSFILSEKLKWFVPSS
jgi:hypothetical protein